MLNDWKNWCRLCASEEPIIKIESISELLPIIQKFSSHFYGNSSLICSSCFQLLNVINKFTEKCAKVDKMYSDLLLDINTESDLISLKLHYGLENGGDAEHITIAAVHSQHVDHQIINVDDVEIKQEVELGPTRSIARKRKTRSKKNMQEEPDSDCNDVDRESLNSDTDYIENGNFEVQNKEQIENYEGPEQQEVNTNNDRVKFECKICKKIYARGTSLKNHMRIVHKDPEYENEVLVCSKCPKRFSTEKKLKIHEAVHLPNSLKLIHPCVYCDKKFSKSVNVQAHIKAIHIGSRPFICEECGKAFGTKGALKEHQITHSEDAPFACSFCEKRFKNLPRLKTHEDIHNDTQYICPICGLQLNTKRTLKMHMVCHSDKKKFKCNYCGNEFKRSKALKNHLILHTGLRPYNCVFCDKSFANGSNCRSHKKKAHPVELAALEASGEQIKVTNIPKLEHLQPKPHQIQQLQQLQQAMVSGLTGENSNNLTNDLEQTQTLPSLNLHSGNQQESVQSQLLQEYAGSLQTMQGIVLPSSTHLVRISLSQDLQH